MAGRAFIRNGKLPNKGLPHPRPAARAAVYIPNFSPSTLYAKRQAFETE